MADLDNGFLRLACDLVDRAAMQRYGITAREFRVLMVVSRKTYGFNKKLDWISGAQLAEATEMTENQARDAIRSLVERRILVRVGRKIGWNTAISEWQSKQPQSGVNDPKVGSLNNPEMGLCATPNRGHTKDNIQKTKDKTIVATSGSQSAGAELPCVIDKPVAKQATKQPAIQYQAFADAYNAILGHRLPRCEALSEKRKRAIKTLTGNLRPDRPAIDAFTAYLEDFRDHASGFYFGENDRGWRASFDYLVRVDTLIKAREGALMEGGRS